MLRVGGLQIDFDLGRVCSGGVEKDVEIQLRSWGPVFTFWPRRAKRSICITWMNFTTYHGQTRLEMRFQKDLQAHFKQEMRSIDRGKRKHPAMMTQSERHQETAQLAQQMRWSKNFVRAMCTPLSVRALNAGTEIRSEWGDRICLKNEKFILVTEDGQHFEFPAHEMQLSASVADKRKSEANWE